MDTFLRAGLEWLAHGGLAGAAVAGIFLGQRLIFKAFGNKGDEE